GTEILVDGVKPEEKTNSLLWIGLGLLGVLLIGGGAVYWFYFREHGFNFGSGSVREITSENKVIPSAVKRPVMPAAVQRQQVPTAEEPKPAAQRASIFANGSKN